MNLKGTSRKLFITFGEDSNHLRGLGAAAKRLELQARASGQFAEVIRLDSKSIQLLPNFEVIKPIFSEDLWGFGYFVWKPFILNWVMTEFGKSFDYIIYADAGCELQFNRTKIRLFHTLLNQMNTQSCLAYFTELPEILMTKQTVLSMLKTESDKFYGQIEATVIFLRTDDCAFHFVREWFDICTRDSFAALMPVRDETNDLVKLQLHIYDQSVFSVLYKNNFEKVLTPIRPKIDNAGKISAIEEFIYASNFIWPVRNRSEFSKLKNYMNHSMISEIAVYSFKLYRLVRKIKHRLDPRAKNNRILQLLIRYREGGFISFR